MKHLANLVSRYVPAASLALCIIMAIFWVRGRFTNDEVYLNLNSHLIIAGSFPNHGNIIFYYATDYHGPIIRVLPHDKHVPPQPEFWQVRVNGNSHRYELSIPWWLPMLISLALPTSAVWQILMRQRRIQKGFCVNCNYDLRASKDRCPECGTAIPKAIVRVD